MNRVLMVLPLCLSALACSSPGQLLGTGQVPNQQELERPAPVTIVSFCGDQYPSNTRSLDCSHYESDPPLDLQVLKRFPLLRSFRLESELELELSVLAELPELTSLALVVPSIATLPALPKLSRLSVQVDDGELGPVSAMTGLASLELSPDTYRYDAPLTLPELGGLTRLVELGLSHAELTDFEPLGALTSLEVLRLDWTNLNELSFVSSLPKLRLLDISYTEVESLLPLAALGALEYFFYVAAPSTLSLLPLEGLPLRAVDLSASYELDLSPLMEIDTLELLMVEQPVEPKRFASRALEYPFVVSFDAEALRKNGEEQWLLSASAETEAGAVSTESPQTIDYFEYCEQLLSTRTRAVHCGYENTVAPLSRLPALEALSLEGVDDDFEMDSLATLPALRALKLDGGLSRLPVLPGLEALSVELDATDALEGLRSQPALQRLELLLKPELELELSPLAQLSIRELALVGQVERLPTLASLRSMKVELQDVDAPSLSFLQSQPQLESLELLLPREPVELEVLAKLTSLRSLRIQGGEALELAPLGQLSNLERLELFESSALSLAALSGLATLRELRVKQVRFEQLEAPPPVSPDCTVWKSTVGAKECTTPVAASVLGTLQGLETLVISEVDLAELGRVEELGRLQTLELSYSRVDLERFVSLPRLESLSLEGSVVTGFEELSRWTGLRMLNLESAADSTLAPLASLSKLERLDVSSNRELQSLEGLEGLTALRVLDFSNTPVSDLAPLSGLTQLRVLVFERTQVAQLSPLSTLTALEVLLFSGAEVTELAGLEGLEKLRILALNDSGIENDAWSSLPALSLLLYEHDSYCSFRQHVLRLRGGVSGWHHFEPRCR